MTLRNACIRKTKMLLNKIFIGMVLKAVQKCCNTFESFFRHRKTNAKLH